MTPDHGLAGTTRGEKAFVPSTEQFDPYRPRVATQGINYQLPPARMNLVDILPASTPKSIMVPSVYPTARVLPLGLHVMHENVRLPISPGVSVKLRCQPIVLFVQGAVQKFVKMLRDRVVGSSNNGHPRDQDPHYV